MTRSERRKRARLGLRLPILVLGTKCHSALRCETADISTDGFYCNTSEPFAPGEKLTCLVALPTRPPAPQEDGNQLCLEAEVEVVRLVMNNGDGFGIGCRILEYRVLSRAAAVSWAQTEQGTSSPIIEQLV